MDVSVFAEHTTQASALPEPPETDCSNLIGISCPPAEATLGPGYWCLEISLPTLTFYSFLSRFLTPLASVPSSHHHPYSEEGLSQEAKPAFVYQRSDYIVGCYLSLGDGCRVSRMTMLTPVGDVWSGMERHGLTEVLRSYRSQCDLNSHWIPWGDKRPQLRGGNQALQLILLRLCIQRASADLLTSTFVKFLMNCASFSRTSISKYWLMASTAIETRDVYQQQLSDGHDLSLELSFSLKSGSDRFSQHRGNYSFG